MGFRKGKRGEKRMHQIGIERLKFSVFPLFGRNSEFKFSEISGFFGGGGGGSEKTP